MEFPIPLDQFVPLKFSLSKEELDKESLSALQKNIGLLRDAIIFFTAYANAKGLGGHTGGAYDIVPEMLIADAFRKGSKNIHPFNFDEAGHRVAIHYLMAALDKSSGMKIEELLHYREFDYGLPGHPDIDESKGIHFSSGRLGHLFGHVNGVAEQNPGMHILLFGSDGAQQEGNDAEAARYAAAHNLKVVLIIDDNDVTIESHPSSYLPTFSLEATFSGHGISVDQGDGEDIARLFKRIRAALLADKPIALINKRKMMPGVNGVEGSTKGHDSIPVEHAVTYLASKGHDKAVSLLSSAKAQKDSMVYLGSSREFAKNRVLFGSIVSELLAKKSEDERKKVLVVSNDLGGSCGLSEIGEKFPKIYRKAGVMERGNFLLAAGFGSRKGYQGIYATFSAFLEMVISEITMSRLNNANVLAHFSHSGVDEMADNTCHYGLNNFFAGGSFEKQNMLYFPADPLQLKAILEKIFDEEGLRFVFSTRSAVPYILDSNGRKYFEKYRYTGRDDVILDGKGYIVTYGEMLYRCLHAAEELRKEDMEIGVINKSLLNVPDENMMRKLGRSEFVLVVESQSVFSGLGIRFGTWLLERGHHPRYGHLGTHKYGNAGLIEHIANQGLDPSSIKKKVKSLSAL